MATQTMSKDDILEAIGNMSVFELAELIEAFKEKFGVTIAAPAAAPAGGAAGAAGGAAAPAAEEQTEFTVVLTFAVTGKPAVMMLVPAGQISYLGISSEGLSANANFLRSVEQSKEVSDELWSSVLHSLTERRSADLYAQLCFNFTNPLVRKIAGLRQELRDPLRGASRAPR